MSNGLGNVDMIKRCFPTQVLKGDEVMTRIFVYGTLIPVATQVAHSEVLEDSISFMKLYDLGPFPAAIRTTDKDCILHGVHFLIDPITLSNFDAYEGSLYRRSTCITNGGHKCVSYLFHSLGQMQTLINSGVARVLPSGKWL